MKTVSNTGNEDRDPLAFHQRPSVQHQHRLGAVVRGILCDAAQEELLDGAL